MTVAIAFQGSNVAGHGHVFADPRQNLRAANGQLSFFLTGSGTAATVYQDAGLTTPYTQPIIADAGGTFAPIYLNPFATAGKLRVQLKTAGGASTVWTVDPYWIPQVLTTTSGSLQQDTQGEIKIPAPSSTVPALTLNGRPGSPALWLVGANTASGGVTEPAIEVTNSAVTTGTHTATFVAANKPGTATTSPSVWLPLLVDGVVYYTPCWSGDTSGAASVASGAQAQVINADQVIFNSNGTISLIPSNVGTANPTNWYFPTTAGIGASYWISVTQHLPVGGISVYNAAAGNWQKIGNGLAFNLTQQSTLGGASYQIAQDSGGAPGTIVVTNGTLNLTSVVGVQNQNLIGGSALSGAVTWNSNGTSAGGTFNNYGPEQWYYPTTAAIGASYWLTVTVNSGTITGITPGTPTSLSSGITLTYASGGSAQGTYTISTTSGGTPIVAGGQWLVNPTLT